MLTITDKARDEVLRLIDLSIYIAPKLRIAVVGGGCSGMSYKLDFDHEGPKSNDKSFVSNCVGVLVDSKSALFIEGMTLDFSDGLNGTGFVFSNPNAKRTCGCGSSFSC